ncbi:MAG: cohesin domain-containing protein [Acidobacteriota bacterium]
MLLALLFAAPVAAGGVALQLVPSATAVEAGETVDIDVVVSGLGGFSSPALRTFDVTVTFDPAIFAYDSILAGVLLGDAMAATPEATVTISPGVDGVRVLEVSFLATPDLLALQPASFTLLTATFAAAGPGDGDFDLVLAGHLGDELADPLTPGGQGGTSVTVMAPPTLEIPTLSPWGLALMLVALAAAGLARLRGMGR